MSLTSLSFRSWLPTAVMAVVFSANLVVEASDCECPKPEVEISVRGYYEDKVDLFFNGEEISSGTKHKLEVGPSYSLSIEAISEADLWASSPSVTLDFPHCDMEYSTNDGVSWKKGSNAAIRVTKHSDSQTPPVVTFTYNPESILIRVAKPESDDPNDVSSPPGSGANADTTPPSFSLDEGTNAPVLKSAGMGLEIPMGAAPTSGGYRSAGLLVNYGAPNGSFAAPSALRYTGIKEVEDSVIQHSVLGSGEVTTEKHYVAPQGAMRVRGWNSTTQSPVNWQGATATLVEVYNPSQYTIASHSFSGNPHSYYRLEVANGGDLMPGVKLTQSNHGVLTTRIIQTSGDGYTLEDTNGGVFKKTTLIPPAASETLWERKVEVTKNSIIISSTSETYDLVEGQYLRVAETRDPSAALGDEITTEYQYYSNGKLRSSRTSDGSWNYYTYTDGSTTTYSPWLSEPSLVKNVEEWELPSSGLVLKSTSSSSPNSSSSVIFNLAGNSAVAPLSSSSTTVTDAAGYTRTIQTRNKASDVFSNYSLEYSHDNTNKFLAGRMLMTWDQAGRATRYEYEKGNWSAPVFTPDSNGSSVRTSVYSGYLSVSGSDSELSDFQHLPLHSVKEVTITTDKGIVREETHICSSGSTYQLAVAKDHEYESGGLRRRLGTRVNGVYVSKIQYVPPFITREWDDEGSMVETERNAEGKIIRSTTSGNGVVPSSTTIYAENGLTSTISVNGQIVSTTVRDAIGRTVSTTDATGAITEITYLDGGKTVRRTGPGGVITEEAHHLDGQLISITGTSAVNQFYKYEIDDELKQVRTTTSTGTSTSPRYRSVTAYGDGSPNKVTFPNPDGGSSPILHEYSYSGDPETSGNTRDLFRVITSAPNTAYQTKKDVTLSSEGKMGHYSLVGRAPDLENLANGTTHRVTETSMSYLLVGGIWHEQRVTKRFHTDNSDASYATTELIALAPVAVSHATYGSGLRWTTSTSNGATTTTHHRDCFFNSATVVESSDDSSTSVSPDAVYISQHGRGISSSRYGSTSPETRIYDAAGRVVKVTSSTGAVTTYSYNSSGQLESEANHDGKVTSYIYHPNNHQNAGLIWKVTNPASETVETLYNTRGQMIESKGNGTYRVTYDYNLYGEMHEMRTYRTPTSAGDLTQWTYSPSTGLLLEKTDAASKKTTYTYHPSGLLKTRSWARSAAVTTYGYNVYGELTSKNYSDSTPNVTIVPDRLGRPKTITDASGTRTLTYHSFTGAPDLVTYGASGLLHSLQIDYTFDGSSRPTGYSVAGGPASVIGYDTAGRLSTVASYGSTHTHGYVSGTDVLDSMTTTTGATTVLTRTLYRDRMQRIRGIATKNGAGATLSRHGYTLDDAGRRITAARENGQRWDYGYDTLGQVTSATKRFPDGLAIQGHNYQYSYDGIGNRLSAVHGGVNTGVTYTSNSVNQYSTVATNGGRFIMGEAPAANSVTINGTAASRAGGLGFYWRTLSAANSSAPVWSNDTVVSNGVTISGRTWTPSANVSPTYDDDGNLKSDGRWDYTWNAENQLIEMKATSTALTAATAAGIPVQKLEFVYDSQGRRVSKTVSTSTNGTTWTFQSNRRYLYDDWNLIAEYSAPTATSDILTLESSHVWGSDLSGSAQGAGGVGGLLATHLVTAPAAACFPAYDGNGNISGWVNGSGALMARMDYSPFGQLISQYKLTTAATNALPRLPFGFSTKYTDSESGLLYYGYRYYDQVKGRWINRDPIEEMGGINLYGFIGNSGTNLIDFVGLRAIKDGPYEVQIAAEGINVMGPSVTLEAVAHGSDSEGPSITDPSLTVEGVTEIELGGILSKIGITGLQLSVSFSNLKEVGSNCVDQAAMGPGVHSLVKNYEADISASFKKTFVFGGNTTEVNLGKLKFKLTDIGCGPCK